MEHVGCGAASSCSTADARQHVGLLLYKMSMYKHYFFALARVPRWGGDQLERLNCVGVVPTFEKDRVPLAEEPTEVPLRFDVGTQAEARALLRRALGSKARIISPIAWLALPPHLDGLTQTQHSDSRRRFA